MQSTRKLAAIMFADIVGYTSMMQENEEKAKVVRDRHRNIISEQVQNHSGQVVQYYGDGALAIFSSAKESVMAAIKIQQILLEEPKVPLRIGIHLGDIVHDKEGVFGDGVNIASRIESMAMTGSVLFSDRVFQEICNHPAIKAVYLGEYILKNVKSPVKVYGLDEEGLTFPIASDLISGKHRRTSKSIAIMPFTNMSSVEKSDYFAEGVSEEIINGLTTVEGISVISRSTCNAIFLSEEDHLAIGRSLNVSHFLVGSVRRSGDRVRVSVQLVSTNDGYQIWAETYDRNLDDIFEVQDEIARKVVTGLKVSFDISSQDDMIVPKVTDDIKAYKLHLKGLHHWRKGNPDEARKAVEKFEQALQIDPTFAHAQCALSHCHSYLGSCGALPPVDAFAKALKYAMIAIENNPKFAEGHLAMANIKFYHFWDWDAARASLEKAEALGLNSAELHQSYGLYYAAAGKPAEGVKKMLKALELDPLSVPVMNMLGSLYLFNEQYEEAISTFAEILELEPSYRAAHQFKGVALGCSNRHDEALAEFEIYHREVNHPQKALLGLIISNHAMGHKEVVEELLGRLYVRLETDFSAAVEIDLAMANASVGNYDAAIRFLERVYDKRLSIACMGMIWIMRCPHFKAFWSHPDYLKLIKRMGLDQ